MNADYNGMEGEMVVMKSGKLQQLLDLTNAARHGQLLAILKNHHVFAFEQRLQLFDAFHVDEHGAADAHEFLRVKLFLQGRERLPEDMILAGSMQDHIIAGGLHVIDLVSFNE